MRLLLWRQVVVINISVVAVPPCGIGCINLTENKMLKFLLEALASGEHLLTVVGVGGTTQQALAHTFIDALIAEIQKHDPALNEQVALAAPLVETVSPAALVPTEEQIAAYLAAHPVVALAPVEAAPSSVVFPAVEKPAA